MKKMHINELDAPGSLVNSGKGFEKSNEIEIVMPKKGKASSKFNKKTSDEDSSDDD